MTNLEMLRGKRSKVLGTIEHENLTEGKCKVIFQVISKYPWDACIVLRDSGGSQRVRFGGCDPHNDAFRIESVSEWLDL